MKTLKLLPVLLLILLAVQIALAQGSNTGQVVAEGEKRLTENKAAQKTIDTLHEQTHDLVEEYQTLLKVVDGLKIYNQIMAKQLQNQDQEIEILRESIANAAVIQRQILPLLTRMLDSLDDFVELDVPFLFQERQTRINNLRRLILQSDLSNAEKARRVFEAFQIENDFGNTIESYKGKLNLDNKTFDVDYLRVGRVAFMYRTVGSEEYGYWNQDTRTWHPINSSHYKRNIDKGIKMATGEMAPELLTVPIANVGGNG